MTERIRFHLDEHVDPDIARALRRYGIDVTTTVESGLRTQPDEAQWAFINQEQRVMVTHDATFYALPVAVVNILALHIVTKQPIR